MVTVVCCGAATLDTIYRVECLPTGPGKLLPTAMIEVAHGMATSAAAAVARLGGRARLAARVGDDAGGGRFVAEPRGGRGRLRWVRQGGRGADAALHGAGRRRGRAAGGAVVRSGARPGPGWLPLDGWPRPTPCWPTCAGRRGRSAVLVGGAGGGAPGGAGRGHRARSRVDGARRGGSHAVFSEPAALAVGGWRRVREALGRLAGRRDGFLAVTAGADAAATGSIVPRARVEGPGAAAGGRGGYPGGGLTSSTVPSRSPSPKGRRPRGHRFRQHRPPR